MDLSTNTILDKFIKEDKLHELKASEITRVRKEQSNYVALSLLALVDLFFLVVSGVAFGLWSNKFTLFLFIIVGLVSLGACLLAFYQFKVFNKTVKQVVKRVNGEGEKK